MSIKKLVFFYEISPCNNHIEVDYEKRLLEFLCFLLFSMTVSMERLGLQIRIFSTRRNRKQIRLQCNIVINFNPSH